jgi:hypothetical protein
MQRVGRQSVLPLPHQACRLTATDGNERASLVDSIARMDFYFIFILNPFFLPRYL